MKVREILAIKGEHVHTIEPERTVLDAVALLVEHGIGALLVREVSGAVAGIISERDVLRVSRDRSGELGSIPVADVMTRELIVCVPDDDVDYAMGIVTKNRVRHLPVLDTEYENRYLREYIDHFRATARHEVRRSCADVSSAVSSMGRNGCIASFL
jgi:CBS domain-containing protein